jgi:hypothetical protein
MLDEAKVIYSNILDTNDYALIHELSMVIDDNDKLREINVILAMFSDKSEVFDYNHPFTDEYKEVSEKKLEIERELQRKIEEKEKVTEEKKKDDVEKLEATYKNVIRLINKDQMTTALVMLWKNNMRLGREFPELYYILKLLNKEKCIPFDTTLRHENDEIQNTEQKEFLNRIIDMGNKIEKAINAKRIPDSLKKELSTFKSNSMYFKCLHDIRRIIVSHVRLYFSKQEQRAFFIRWTLL